MYDVQGVSQSDTLVQLDARRRANLGKVGKKEHRLYAVEQMDDGTLVFRPCAVVIALSGGDRYDPTTHERQ